MGKKSSLYDTLVPGTHDSAAYTARPDLLSRTAPSVMVSRTVRMITARIQAEFALTQRLSIRQQLEAGARFLDLRISKIQGTDEHDDTFWTVHGMVLCVPLDDVLQQLVQFQRHQSAHFHSHSHSPVVLAVRTYELSVREVLALGERIVSKLGDCGGVFIGDSESLGKLALENVPPFVLAGIAPSQLSSDWGQDCWTNTYDSEKKISFLRKTLLSSPPKACSNSSNSSNRSNRELLVLGWTVTPNVLDVALRWISGFLRRTLLEEAESMNALCEKFTAEHQEEIREKVHVVFFDAFTEKQAQLIEDISAVSRD